MAPIDPIRDGQASSWKDPRRDARQAHTPTRVHPAAKRAASPSASIGDAWAAHMATVSSIAWVPDVAAPDALPPRGWDVQADAGPVPASAFPYDDPVAWRLTISMYHEQQPMVVPDEAPGSQLNVKA